MISAPPEEKRKHTERGKNEEASVEMKCLGARTEASLRLVWFMLFIHITSPFIKSPWQLYTPSIFNCN